MTERRATCPTCGKRVVFFARTAMPPHRLRLHIDVRTGQICEGNRSTVHIASQLLAPGVTLAEVLAVAERFTENLPQEPVK